MPWDARPLREPTEEELRPAFVTAQDILAQITERRRREEEEEGVDDEDEDADEEEADLSQYELSEEDERDLAMPREEQAPPAPPVTPVTPAPPAPPPDLTLRIPLQAAMNMVDLFHPSFLVAAPGLTYPREGYSPREGDRERMLRAAAPTTYLVPVARIRNSAPTNIYYTFEDDLGRWLRGAAYRLATQADIEELTYRTGGVKSLDSEHICSRCLTTTGVGLVNMTTEDRLCRRCIVTSRDDGTWQNCHGCGHAWMIQWAADGRTYCQSHMPVCCNCGDRSNEDSVRDPSGRTTDIYCSACADEIFMHCVNCSGWITESNAFYLDEDEDEEGNYVDEPEPRCENCHYSVQERRARVRGAKGRCLILADEEIPSPATEVPFTFGVEIEAHFNDIRLGGYHSGREADKPFFSKWRAETDGSIYNGGEIISPILRGVGGVAEVAATMELMKEMEASVTGACGQHIHIGRTQENGSTVPMISVHAVTAFLEDTLLATTGRFRRWNESSYSARIKSQIRADTFASGSRDIAHYLTHRADSIVSGRNVAAMTGYDTVEYRYPPGTLNKTQFIINHGLCNLMTAFALDAPEDTLKELLENSRSVINAAVTSVGGAGVGGPWVHDSIVAGAKFISEIGEWNKGGKWIGIPYAPKSKSATEVKVVDQKRDQEREVSLASEADLIKRLHRQVTNFYVSAHRIAGWWSESEGKAKADEVVEIFAA